MDKKARARCVNCWICLPYAGKVQVYALVLKAKTAGFIYVCSGIQVWEFRGYMYTCADMNWLWLKKKSVFKVQSLIKYVCRIYSICFRV